MKDIKQIKHTIQHRYPFLLVDRILEQEEGKLAVGIKQVTANEPFFQGHFPDYAVMPGVLIVEALAQLGGFAMAPNDQQKGRLAFLAGIDECRFKCQVRPGDTLRLEFEILKQRGKIVKGKGKAFVGSELACEAVITFALDV
ncbi:3-hydroxyacyl-ACP dehydratase FabZ [Priestia aryabhattai]|uniref:3-hydroxyacyl-ACP dehydratase FabZ n=1 Tax=Priestia aryabhattai TaxID=412384 RepID=UPI0008DD5890|nr:3-hydroxyacyl-ACP dehydratase FabZ [Priestia aryabhattai]MBX9966775.1 3-hydroxyacyl-ACP dehydratase FabZ [Priestia aryabhattai]MBZ6487719.1 3-hydroxyacyl-ACP dehydratase FabZ [Priestia aryabhattai]MDH3114573.1 3-hydroxyacyl-ACP dehydratase FabZ [Priestia aryabhattai]MDH3126528.1 3-hydroxyacyl-ACP dehydratase FabZ [Priestia aryabhattai]MDH3133221.1 3-hydroxyacyl-ACP dehydratase FabZ [Priestia aryabhattai]